MNKYEKFTKITDLVIEMAELIKDDNIPDSSQFQSGMKEFIPKEYETVQRNLFPPQYIPYYTNPPQTLSPYGYGYGQPQQQSWSSAWEPGSPVTQQRDIFDSFGVTMLKEAMKKEEEDLDDATKFIESVTPLLPKGCIKNSMPVMGDILEAVRNKDFKKATQLVKDNWVEEGSTDTNNEKKSVWSESDPDFDPYNPRESLDELREDNNEDITD